MPLTNKYLKYTPEITFEVFEKIWNKLLEHGWVSNAGYTIQERWKEFSGDYPGFQSVNPTTKKFFTGSIPDRISSVTETTVDEILNFGKSTENSTILYKDLEIDKVYFSTWGKHSDNWRAIFRKKKTKSIPWLSYHEENFYINTPDLNGGHRFRLPTKDELAWFEYCEKNDKYISYEDFIKLPVEKLKSNTWYKHTISEEYSFCSDTSVLRGQILDTATGDWETSVAVYNTEGMSYWIEVTDTEHKLIQQILLDKANRDYPVGTKFISALKNDPNPYKGDVCKGFYWSKTYWGSEVLFNGNGIGFIYDNGVWAKKVEEEKPVTVQEIIDFKDSLFYVECIHSESEDSFIKGKKYLASEYKHDSKRFILEQPKENGLSKGNGFPYEGGCWKFKKIEPEKSVKTSNLPYSVGDIVEVKYMSGNGVSPVESFNTVLCQIVETNAKNIDKASGLIKYWDYIVQLLDHYDIMTRGGLRRIQKEAIVSKVCNALPQTPGKTTEQVLKEYQNIFSDQTPLIPQPFEMEISKRVILFPVVEEITLK